ncbi:SRPBCC family protein [Amycolatopsis sp. NBC_00345]|uniref:SRPBCC family protein n=1 Tax=Amycolatopsis sp. NBC_00345 TaxID=2975955 RepID=UPI002E25A8C7
MTINGWIKETSREVRSRKISDGPGYSAVIARTYDSSPEEVWDALTTPDRIARFFLPVTGDLKEGGKFQLENHAGGDIIECDKPRRIHLTWVAEGHPAQELIMTLTADGKSRTTLELEHVGPGEGDDAISHVLAVGVGWDPALVGFGQYLAGEEVDKAWWMESEEAIEFTKLSVRAWADVLEKAKVAPAKDVHKAADETLKFYTPE